MLQAKSGKISKTRTTLQHLKLFFIKRSVCEQLQNLYSRTSAKNCNDKSNQVDPSLVFMNFELGDAESQKNSEVNLV